MGEYNYDEQGQFFPFFVTALLLIILLPTTYTSLFKPKLDSQVCIDCSCETCEKKHQALATQKRKEALKPTVIRKYVLVVIGWAIVIYMCYLIATTKVENQIWDPYAILGISTSSPLDKIKSHYKRLSKQLHPDKIKLVGNLTKEMVEQRFVDLTKAYKALTDEEIRRNYQEYGHPDGKQEYSIGIALPKWIVESSNGYFVLAFYGLLFGGLLPAIVGRWWYGSQKLTKDGIETETAARYFRAVKENMSANDIVDVLSTTHEFENYLTTNDRINKIDTVSLEKKLGQAGVPLKTQYQHVPRSENTDLSHNLIHAHLNRLVLDPALEAEKTQIIANLVKFQQGLIQIALAFNFYDPIRSAMEISQHILQALPVGSCPLQQLPGIDKKLAQSLGMEKCSVKTIQDLLALKEHKRRKTLEVLDEQKYQLAMCVAKQIPILIVSNAHFKVTGDKIVTPGAIVKLVFSARLATQKDFDAKANSNGSTSSEPSSDNSDVEEEDDVDILIGRKRAHNDGEPVPIPLAHVPYFPTEHKPRWWAFLADLRGNRIIVHPSVITDIGTSPRKFRIQFQAPPQVASYLFQFHVKSDSYLGTDFVQDIMLTVDDVSKLQEKIVEEIIPEGDEEDDEDKDEDENESADESDESEDTDTDTNTDTDSDSN